MLFNDTGSKMMISETKKEVLKQCKDLSNICTAIWWVYNAGLALTCTYQAFRTRKLPENYNEAKFITFTMVITCIVVTIFIPTYIGTGGIYRTTITCFVFIIGGFSTLCCMFVPKLYIILWRPEKNVPMQPRSSTIRLGTISPSASFVRRLSVDSNAERVREGRQTRIHSLPAIEMNRVNAEDENSEDAPKFKKTKRSFSLSPDMLSRAQDSSDWSPDRVQRMFSARRRGSSANPQYPACMDMIEEGNEFEQVETNEVFESDELCKELEQLKPEVYDRDKSKDSLYVEVGDSEFNEMDGLLSSTTDENDHESLQEKADFSCEESFTSLNGVIQNDNSTTCTLNNEDYLDETKSESNLKTRNSPEGESALDLTCEHCGSKLTQTSKGLLLKVLSKHLSNNGRIPTGEKFKIEKENCRMNNIVKTQKFQSCQHGKNIRKRKSGLVEAIPDDKRFASSGLDVNDNRPVKRLRNPSYYQCESLSLPSIITHFSEGDPLDFMASKKVKEKNKALLPNGKNCVTVTRDDTSLPNGDISHPLTNGEVDDLTTETDGLLSQDGEIETRL